MKRHPLLVIFFLFALTGFSQNKMKPIEELIDKAEPGWDLVKYMIDHAKNKVEILPVDSLKAKEAVYKLQANTHSSMGAVTYMTGGILVDDGWIRILGSGSEKLGRTLPDWNIGKTFKKFGEKPGYLLIADDAFGGFFMLNGGALGKDVGKVYYFSPFYYDFDPMNVSYTQFLNFCFNGNLDVFYQNKRWKGWREDITKLNNNQVFSFESDLSTEDSGNFNKLTKKIISVEEQYQGNMEVKKEKDLNKD